MTRIYVPLDKDMTDAEVVQALKDAAAKHNAEKKASEEVKLVEESSANEEHHE